MPAYAAEELPWGHLRRLGHQGALFLLPLGPIEDHGPHLPSGVDYYTAREFTRELAERLAKEGHEVVVLPTLALGASMLYTLGCLRIPVSTTERVVRSLGLEMAREGVRRLAVVTTHGAVTHLKALEKACETVTERTRLNMISPCRQIIMKFLSGGLREQLERRLGEKFSDEDWNKLCHDYHAGAWETALMLRYRPDLVRSFYRELPGHTVKSIRGISTHRGYFGYPALASEKLGHAAEEVLVKEGLVQLRGLLKTPLHAESKGKGKAWLPLAVAATVVGVGLFYKHYDKDSR